jgi:hypothetical protein
VPYLSVRLPDLFNCGIPFAAYFRRRVGSLTPVDAS